MELRRARGCGQGTAQERGISRAPPGIAAGSSTQGRASPSGQLGMRTHSGATSSARARSACAGKSTGARVDILKLARPRSHDVEDQGWEERFNPWGSYIGTQCSAHADVCTTRACSGSTAAERSGGWLSSGATVAAITAGATVCTPKLQSVWPTRATPRSGITVFPLNRPRRRAVFLNRNEQRYNT